MPERQHCLPLSHVSPPVFFILIIPPHSPKTLSDILSSHFSQLLVLLQLSNDVQ